MSVGSDGKGVEHFLSTSPFSESTNTLAFLYDGKTGDTVNELPDAHKGSIVRAMVYYDIFLTAL